MNNQNNERQIKNLGIKGDNPSVKQVSRVNLVKVGPYQPQETGQLKNKKPENSLGGSVKHARPRGREERPVATTR